MTPEQAALLRKPFADEHVGKLPRSTCRACTDSQRKRCDNHAWVSNCPLCHGNHTSATIHLDYVGHAATTDRLLAVDPEWNWEPMALDGAGLPAMDGGRNLWIRLTVAGVTRLGVGDGKSVKECIGDAIRNAAMRFGVALDLWAKDDLELVTTHADDLRGAMPAFSSLRRLDDILDPPTVAAEQVPMVDGDVMAAQLDSEPESPLLNTRSNLAKKMYATIGQAGIPEDQRVAFIAAAIGRPIESSKEMTDAEAHELLDNFDALLTAWITDGGTA